MAHWYDNDTLTASPSQINFLIFVPLFSFLSLVYLELTPRFLTKGIFPFPSRPPSPLTNYSPLTSKVPTNNPSLPPTNPPLSLPPNNPLLLRRFRRPIRLPQQTPLLPRIRLRRRPRRRRIRSFLMDDMDRFNCTRSYRIPPWILKRNGNVQAREKRRC